MKLKKLLTLFTLLLLCSTAAWADEPDPWEGEGTEKAPFLIKSTTDLDALATRVNAGITYEDVYFQLFQDITYDNKQTNNFTTIGTSETGFNGNFDGNGKKISGIRINKQSNSYQALFSKIEAKASVSNLTLDDTEITGNVWCAGIAVMNTGTLKNCVCTVKLSVIGNGIAGGIVGWNFGTMEGNILINSSIPPLAIQCGAICGTNSGTLSNNYYVNCFFGDNANATYVGVGSFNDGPKDIDGEAMPIGALTLATGITASPAPNIVRNDVNYYLPGTEIKLKYNGESGDKYIFTTNDGMTLNGTFKMPARVINIVDVEEETAWGVPTGADGTKNSPFIISSTQELDLLATRVNNGNTYEDVYFQLGQDLTYDNKQTNNFTTIGTSETGFNGIFDGNGKKISGIRINKPSDSYQALFSIIGVKGSVSNLTLDDIEITGNNNCGGIAGYNNGTIKKCVCTVKLSIQGTCVGGIVAAHWKGTIEDNMLINSTIPSKYDNCGAICGYNSATLSNNYYINCTSGNNANATGIGCGSWGGASDIDGAKPLGSLTLAEGITASPDPYIVINNVNYYTPNTEISLKYNGVSGDNYIFTTDDDKILNGTFKMPAQAINIVKAEIETAWGVPEGANGSQNKPYLISTTQDLDLLATRVNNGNDYKGVYFQLKNNIQYSTEGLGATASNFTPIGNQENKFKGMFNGNFKTISGIQIYNADGSYQGLFGAIEEAEIYFLTLSNATIIGKEYCGGIAGYKNSGAIYNCTIVNTTVKATSINGGVAGENEGQIRNCFVDEVTISKCSDNTYGAICGSIPNKSFQPSNYYLLDNFYFNCKVGDVSTASGIGIGDNEGTSDLTEYNGALPLPKLTLADGITTTTNPRKTLNGDTYYTPKTEITLQYNGEAGDGYIFTTADGEEYGGTFSMPSKDVSITSAKKADFWGIADGRDGSEKKPYLISSTDDLDQLAKMVNTGNDFDGKYFQVTKEITYSTEGLASTASNYTVIGTSYKTPFNGNFDGNGKTISGIQIYNEDGAYIGLFGYLDIHANVTNITLANTRITGYELFGGIAGFNNGKISNCKVSNSVTIAAVSTSPERIGGIVGENYGEIMECTSSVQMTSTSTPAQLGGIVGYNYAGLHNNFAIGVTIPQCSDDTHGAICGYKGEYGSMYANFYINCTVADETTNIGCNGEDLDNLYGASPLYTLSLAEGITDANTPALVYNGKTYYAADLEHTLSYTVPDGYIATFSVNGDEIEGNKFTMPAENTNVTVSIERALWGEEKGANGSQENPYIISSTEGLDLLAKNVNDGNDYKDVYFQLANDIDYSQKNTDENGSNFAAIGNAENSFNGIFEGNNMTIKGIKIFLPENDQTGAALFYGIGKEAKVSNLTLKDAKIQKLGTVVTTYMGGIAVENGGTLTNCHVENVDFTMAMYASGIATLNGGSIINCTSTNVTLNLINSDPENPGVAFIQFGGITCANVEGGSIEGCLVASSTIPEIGTYGAICGGEENEGTMKNNYYNGFKVGKDYITSGVGCGSKGSAPFDIYANDGAVPERATTTTNGAVEIVEYIDGKKKVSLDGNYKSTNACTSITSDITGLAAVELKRDFPKGKYTTVVLPFDAPAATIDGTYYTFEGIRKEGAKWIADVKEATTITANEPYLFQPNEETHLLSWNVSTVKKPATAERTVTDDHGKWTLVGVYEMKKWEEDSETDFGFAAKAKTNSDGQDIQVGDFVRIKKNAFLRPFRCYMYFSNGTSKATFELPTSIEVHVLATVIEPEEPIDNGNGDDNNGDIKTPVSEINSAQSNVKVWSFDKSIFIEAPADTDYQIIDLGGRQLKTGVTNSTREEVTIGGNASGIVIVRIANKSYKVKY